MGLTISQLVYCYGDVYQAVLELAAADDEPLAAEELISLGRGVHEARASAVAAYERQRTEEASAQETRALQRLGSELRSTLDAAFLAFDESRRNAGGVHGQAGALLDRSLRRLEELVGGSLFRVRSATEQTRKQRMQSLATPDMSPPG